jgi:hypothetical protein
MRLTRTARNRRQASDAASGAMDGAAGQGRDCRGPKPPGHTHLDPTVTWHRTALARCTISQPRRVTA